MHTSGIRWIRTGSLALMGVSALMAIQPAAASATHVFGRSFATCDRQDPATGTFRCTVTIVIGSGASGATVVRAEEDPIIGVRPIDATFASAPTRTGGSCAPASVDTSRMPTAVGLVLTADLVDGCTIVLEETLRAQPGELCHSFDAPAANSVSQIAACTTLAASEPMTKDDCKNGGWRSYPHLGFKNQGRCISYVRRQ